MFILYRLFLYNFLHNHFYNTNSFKEHFQVKWITKNLSNLIGSDRAICLTDLIKDLNISKYQVIDSPHQLVGLVLIRSYHLNKLLKMMWMKSCFPLLLCQTAKAIVGLARKSKVLHLNIWGFFSILFWEEQYRVV